MSHINIVFDSENYITKDNITRPSTRYKITHQIEVEATPVYPFECHQSLHNAMADRIISRIKISAAPNEPIREPEIRSQKFWNCWQIADQLADAFPLCAKYTIAAAAEATAVTAASNICTIFEV